MTPAGTLATVPAEEPSPRAIGWAGTAARLILGALLLGIALQGELSGGGLSARSLAFGLVGIPALVVGGQWLRARRTPQRIAATGPWDFALNLGVVVALYFTPWYAPRLAFTADATLYFYGASMLLAAWRGFDGCEVLALSNWLLGREDHIGCAVFAPIDYLERRIRRWHRVGSGRRGAAHGQ